MADLYITQKRSAIGKTKKQKLTLEALGLKRVNQTVKHNDNPVIKGMINVVNHLVQVEEK